MTREHLETGELGPEVNRVEKEVWKKITKSLNEVRKRDNLSLNPLVLRPMTSSFQWEIARKEG